MIKIKGIESDGHLPTLKAGHLLASKGHSNRSTFAVVHKSQHTRQGRSVVSGHTNGFFSPTIHHSCSRKYCIALLHYSGSLFSYLRRQCPGVALLRNSLSLLCQFHSQLSGQDLSERSHLHRQSQDGPVGQRLDPIQRHLRLSGHILILIFLIIIILGLYSHNIFKQCNNSLVKKQSSGPQFFCRIPILLSLSLVCFHAVKC